MSPTTQQRSAHDLSRALAVYTAAYLLYLWFFVELEDELTHWLTLVLLPALLVAWFLRRAGEPRPWRETLRRAGIHREHIGRGVLIGIVSGLALGSLQLVMSRDAEAIWTMIKSGQAFLRLPVTFLLVLLTAGFTEEFFFRGVLQSSLARHWGRSWPAVVVAALVFGVYHLPYAYLLETWPTHGQLWPALQEAVIMNSIMGALIGGIYIWGRNLVAPIICHSLFNAVMLIPKLNFGIHFG